MVQTIGASVGAAVLAAVLQNRAAHHPGELAAAFADTFWWILVFGALALIPALVLPLRETAESGAGPVARDRPGARSVTR